MRNPAHTPYDGSHPLFRIGLQPLDLKHWIEVDCDLELYLGEKQRIEALHPGKTFLAEPDTASAQEEVLSLLADHLMLRFPEVYQKTGNSISINGSPVRLDIGEPKLKTAARLAQEDLLLLRRSESGWRLVAGSLSFPSSWSLQEKFGHPLDQIHAPVPGFGAGTRNAAMITRIFDNLQPAQPVWRMNWSVYEDDQLFHGRREAGTTASRLQSGGFLRVEYQTLRKLPASADILFTIRIHVDPLPLLERLPNRRQICDGFIGLLQQLDGAQLAYKGLTQERDALIGKLRAIANSKTLEETGS